MIQAGSNDEKMGVENLVATVPLNNYETNLATDMRNSWSLSKRNAKCTLYSKHCWREWRICTCHFLLDDARSWLSLVVEKPRDPVPLSVRISRHCNAAPLQKMLLLSPY